MKKTRLKKAGPNRAIERRLNALCRRLVVVVRDHNTCQRCGSSGQDSQIHWAHVQNRQAKSIQWRPFNSLALCAGCHFWFDGDNRKAAREEWWASKWPDRAQQLAIWKTSRPPKINFALEQAWLEQELATAGGVFPGLP